MRYFELTLFWILQLVLLSARRSEASNCTHYNDDVSKICIFSSLQRNLSIPTERHPYPAGVTLTLTCQAAAGHEVFWKSEDDATTAEKNIFAKILHKNKVTIERLDWKHDGLKFECLTKYTGGHVEFRLTVVSPPEISLEVYPGGESAECKVTKHWKQDLQLCLSDGRTERCESESKILHSVSPGEKIPKLVCRAKLQKRTNVASLKKEVMKQFEDMFRQTQAVYDPYQDEDFTNSKGDRDEITEVHHPRQKPPAELHFEIEHLPLTTKKTEHVPNERAKIPVNEFDITGSTPKFSPKPVLPTIHSDDRFSGHIIVMLSVISSLLLMITLMACAIIYVMRHRKKKLVKEKNAYEAKIEKDPCFRCESVPLHSPPRVPPPKVYSSAVPVHEPLNQESSGSALGFTDLDSSYYYSGPLTDTMKRQAIKDPYVSEESKETFRKELCDQNSGKIKYETWVNVEDENEPLV